MPQNRARLLNFTREMLLDPEAFVRLTQEVEGRHGHILHRRGILDQLAKRILTEGPEPDYLRVLEHFRTWSARQYDAWTDELIDLKSQLLFTSLHPERLVYLMTQTAAIAAHLNNMERFARFVWEHAQTLPRIKEAPIP